MFFITKYCVYICSHNRTKVFKKNIQMEKKELELKIKNGDYITLGLKLGIDSGAARMRFKRNNPEAIIAMEKIITSREEIIKEGEPTDDQVITE